MTARRSDFFPLKRLEIKTLVIRQQAFKSTIVREENLTEYDEPSVVAPYSNQLEEQEFISEAESNESKEEESTPVNTIKKKKNNKNPLPSTTVDGAQLTFVEETKVIAEMDVLIKHNQVSLEVLKPVYNKGPG